MHANIYQTICLPTTSTTSLIINKLVHEQHVSIQKYQDPIGHMYPGHVLLCPLLLSIKRCRRRQSDDKRSLSRVTGW